MNLFEFQASQLGRAADDVAGTLAAVKIKLTKAQIAILPSTILADLTAIEADYTGYALHTITWDAPSLDLAGAVQVVGSISVFRPTGTTVTNQIYMCYIVDTTAAILYFAGDLDGAPIPMLSALNQLQLQVVYKPASNSFTITVV